MGSVWTLWGILSGSVGSHSGPGPGEGVWDASGLGTRKLPSRNPDGRAS